MLHIKPAQDQGSPRPCKQGFLRYSKELATCRGKERHPGNEFLTAEAQGARGKEAAPYWCPEDGQKEATCFSWHEVLKVDMTDPSLQVAFWNQRGA